MDPDSALRMALAKLKEARRTKSRQTTEDAIDYLRNLADWLERGGFLPIVENICVHLKERE